MWTYTIDQTSGALCRTYDAWFGHFPSACQVNAGRPALWLAVAVVAGVFVVSSFAWNRRPARFR